MAETILLLTKFASQFSQDYETTDKFNLFLQTLLDENIDAFTKSVNCDQNLKLKYNTIFHPERVQVSKPKPKPKPNVSPSLFLSSWIHLTNLLVILSVTSLDIVMKASYSGMENKPCLYQRNMMTMVMSHPS